MVELLIYIGILGLVVTSFVNIFLVISQSRNKAYVIQEVQANGRIALDMLTSHLKYATDINTSSSRFSEHPAILSFDTLHDETTPSIFDVTSDEGVLRLTQGDDAAVAITSDQVAVSHFAIYDVTSPTSTHDTVQIFLTIEYVVDTAADFSYEQQFQTTITLRNTL